MLNRQQSSGFSPRKIEASSRRSVTAKMKMLPAAPGVYRPQQPPTLVQAKTSQGVQLSRKPAFLPIANRSQGMTQAVQPTMMGTSRHLKPPTAPPVYRPQPKTTSLGLQAKSAAPAAGAAMGNTVALKVRVSAPLQAGKGRYRITAGAGSQQVGSVMLHERDRSSIEVTDLGVDAAHRKQGLGNALIASALRAGLRMGKTRVVLNSQDNGSGRLTNWYQGMGFVRTGGSRRGYPQLEASISRVLSKVTQRQVAPVSALPQANSTKSVPVQRQTANVGWPQLNLTPAKRAGAGGVLAPSVYRPQPLPRVLQTKMVNSATPLATGSLLPFPLTVRPGAGLEQITRRMASGSAFAPFFRSARALNTIQRSSSEESDDSDDTDEDSQEDTESFEEDEDPKDTDYKQGTQKRTGGGSKTVFNKVYGGHPKKTLLGRQGSFEVPCSDCSQPVHVTREGKEKGVFQERGKGKKRKRIALAPPICHLDHNAAATLGAFDEISQELRNDKRASKRLKTILSEGTDQHKQMKQYLEWGDEKNLGPGHTACNSKHLRGDPSYKKMNKTQKRKSREYVKKRLSQKIRDEKKTSGKNFWVDLDNEFGPWGKNHPLGQNPFNGNNGGGGGGGITG
ncbi:MAG: GNAT family N-acetyltransferase [Acidobacteria bacterium]|nr:GNAT family N-acetyltransferase [Acidobacteriota bacterium]